MLYLTPDNASPPLFRAVGCICIADGRLLLLKRGLEKSYPETWGIPGGKVHEIENTTKAVIRELFEETGILTSSENLHALGEFHIVNSDMNFLYAVYRVEFSSPPLVTLSGEHQAFGWFRPEEVEHLDLVPDLRECLQLAGFRESSSGPQLELFPNLGTERSRRDCHALERELSNLANDIRSDLARSTRPYCIAYGPPCAGKSSALAAMHRQDPTLVLVTDGEPLRRGSRLNFYLRRIFEHGQLEYLFKFQAEIFPVRFRLLIEAPDGSLVDESIMSNKAYTRALRDLGWISAYDYQSLYQNYLCYYKLLPRRLRLFYFQAGTEQLMRRMRRRGRVHERFYTKEYLSALSAAFRAEAEVLAEDHEVIVINTETLTTEEIAERYGPNGRAQSQ